MDQSIINNAIDEWRGRLAHVWEQTLDILSNCCDDNIHSAIFETLFFTNAMRVLILFSNFMINLYFWISKGSAAIYLRCGGK